MSLLTVVGLSTGAFAQRTTGTLRGQVLDPQGAVVTDARVTVMNQDTGVAQSLTTSSAGTYNLPSVLPGSYTVTVEAKAFKRFVRKNVTVLADQDNVADAKLEIGSASETVEVTAGGAQVETTSADLNNNFNSSDVLNLPNAGGILNGSPLNLAVLAPNVIAQPGGAVGVGGSVGGTRPRDNNFTIDGVDDNNLGVTGPNSTVIPDSVSEFALQTNQFSAEFGHSAGGQFSLVTKTGTNSLHGSGEWYSQNRNFNSLDNLTKSEIEQDLIPPVTPGSLIAQPAFDNNRFGGTVGGPIIKDKLFFFGAYEYTTLHGQGAPTPLLTPTASGLATLQSMAADSAVLAILNTFPVAPSNNAGNICVNCSDPSNPSTFNVPIGNFVIIGPLFQREHDAQFNADYSRGHHQFGARFTLNQANFIFPVVPTSDNQTEPLHNRKIALTDAWTAKSNVVNDLRLQYSYFFTGFFSPCSPGTTCLQDININELGGVEFGPADNQFQKQDTYQINDTLSWVRGKHTLKFGGGYSHFIYPQFFLPRSNSDNEYLSTQTFINDLVPDNTGRTLRNAGSGYFLGTQSLMSVFAQDDIKVMPRLTLNLGVRYEYWTNPLGNSTQTQNAISNVPGVITFGNPTTDKNNIAPRVGFAFDPTGSGKTSIRGGFGIAYDVKFQNFESISLPPQHQSELNLQSACTLTPTPAWCTNGGTSFLASGGLPLAYTPPTTQAAARALTSAYIDNTVLPKILTWSLGVQHELYRNTTVEVRYLGTRGLELPVQYRRNFESYFDGGGTPLPTYLSASSIPSTYTSSTPTDTNYYLFNPNIYSQYGFGGNVTSDPPLGSSIYHAGSINFTQRSHRFTFNANYTYAHTIDDATNEFRTSLLNPRRAQDTVKLGQDRGNSDLDVRHKFALSLAYALPKVSSGNAFTKALLNGYQINTVVLAQSGQPITLQSDGLDSNGNGDSAGDRLVINPSGSGNVIGENFQGDVFPVCESLAGSTSGAPVGNTYIGPNSYLTAPFNGCATNMSAPSGFGYDPAIGYTPVNSNDRYVIAAGAAQTTVGRNSYFSPGFITWNLSVFKNTYFGETKYLQLRAEVFNILNHPNYSLSNGNIFNVAGSATALGTQGYAFPSDPNFLNPKIFGGGIRSMTLGIKFVF
jgi:hypothetical protein